MCIVASQRFHFHAFALSHLIFPFITCLSHSRFPPPIGAILLFASPPLLEILLVILLVLLPLTPIGDICFLCHHWSYYYSYLICFASIRATTITIRFLHPHWSYYYYYSLSLPPLELLLLLLASFTPVGATTITTCFFCPHWSYYYYYLLPSPPLELLFDSVCPIGADTITV